MITSPAPWAAVALELRSAGSAAPSAPVISAVTSNGITVTSATITWTTDQPSSSQVTYGTTTGYGSSSANISTLTTAHSVNLTGLTSGTTYNFAVLSANAGGKLTTSPNFTFSTPAGALTITSVTSAAITSTSATVTWITNQAILSSSRLSTEHTAALWISFRLEFFARDFAFCDLDRTDSRHRL